MEQGDSRKVNKQKYVEANSALSSLNQVKMKEPVAPKSKKRIAPKEKNDSTNQTSSKKLKVTTKIMKIYKKNVDYYLKLFENQPSQSVDNIEISPMSAASSQIETPMATYDDVSDFVENSQNTETDVFQKQQKTVDHYSKQYESQLVDSAEISPMIAASSQIETYDDATNAVENFQNTVKYIFQNHHKLFNNYLKQSESQLVDNTTEISPMIATGSHIETPMEANEDVPNIDKNSQNTKMGVFHNQQKNVDYYLQQHESQSMENVSPFTAVCSEIEMEANEIVSNVVETSQNI